MSLVQPKFSLTQPRFDQSTYWGRARHFFLTTNPLNILATQQELEDARELLDNYKAGAATAVSEEELWAAKQLYDSAYHPDTGEQMFLPGRMSAQVPFNMVITGCMMTFYKSTPAVVFWQWFNQSFNAVVNYTNRSGDTQISRETMATSYVAATGGALTTALGLNSLVKSLPPLVGRLVPFVACSAANCINIPMMRRLELQKGTRVELEGGEKVGLSKVAAREGIAKVTASRIAMAMPGMVLIPMVMTRLDARGLFRRFPRANAPLQVCLVGLVLSCATPLCCAIFEQRTAIQLDRLEHHIQHRARQKASTCTKLYYNKGL